MFSNIRIKLPWKRHSGQLVYFSRQLYVMLKSGIPLVRALKTLSDQMSDDEMKAIVSSLALQVEQGEPLSGAMENFPQVFPYYFTNMVKAAELGGALEEIFHRLSVFLEKQQKTKRKVISAFVYPAFILAIALIILLVIMTFVVPSFMKMFAEYGEALPGPTRFLLAVSTFIRSKWYIGIGIITLLILGFNYLLQVPALRYKFDNFVLKLPVIGPLLKKFYLSVFAHMLGTLLASGVPILSALAVVKETINNQVFKSLIGQMALLVEEGENITPFLRSNPKVFVPLFVEMVSVGEETGNLPSMLMEIAQTFDDEIDVLVGSLTSILEPFLIVFMGLMVGFIVIAMFLPLFTLTQVMSQ